MLWGYRFVNLLNFKHSASEYKIDYSAFNAVYKTEMSTESQASKDAESDSKCSQHSKKSVSHLQLPLSNHVAVPVGELPYQLRELGRTRSCTEVLHMV